MDTTLTLTSIGGIVGALLLFIVLKRVVGFVFRIILAMVLAGAIIIGAWWWTRSDDSKNANDNRPQKTQSSKSD
ncbi:MAG TPA: hypothetical protein VF791_23695 [Pyrinomonadaceae bacterium]